MSLMEDLVAAARQHNVMCIVIGGDQPQAHAQEWDHAENVAADSEELGQLRTQVQALTAQLAAADQSLADANARAEAARAAPLMPVAPPPPATPQTADNPSRDDAGIEMLGLSEPAIERKLMRLGLDTIGKLASAFGRGSEGPLWVDDKPLLKKDWMIEVGMKVIAGAGPSRASAPTTGGATASDVPEGHTDRPWAERLAAARAKQTSLNEMRSVAAARQAEVDGFEADEEEVPDAIADALFAAEDDVKLFSAQLVATRWCLGLDPNPALTLDEALDQANLGPWMETPQPRLLGD